MGLGTLSRKQFVFVPMNRQQPQQPSYVLGTEYILLT